MLVAYVPRSIVFDTSSAERELEKGDPLAYLGDRSSSDDIDRGDDTIKKKKRKRGSVRLTPQRLKDPSPTSSMSSEGEPTGTASKNDEQMPPDPEGPWDESIGDEPPVKVFCKYQSDHGLSGTETVSKIFFYCDRQ